MPRKKSSSGITIGFFGTGDMDADQAQTLIQEHLNSYPDDPLYFLFIIHSDEWSETMGDLVQMAVNSEIPYEAITSPDDKSRRSFSDALSAASKTHSVADPVEFLKTALVEAQGGRLFMLWDREREDEMQEVATLFLNAGVPAYDLTDSLHEMGFPEDNGDEEEEAEAEETGRIYSKSELQKLDRQQLWQIADQVGVKRSRASAVVIEDILEKQGEAPEAPAEPSEPVAVAETVVPEVVAVEDVWERLDKSLDQFTTRLLGGLEALFAKLPVTTVPEKEDEEERPTTRRRLQRSSN